MIINWEPATWSDHFDHHTGYGIQISSDSLNIIVGNVNPITGKRERTSQLSGFQNTTLTIPNVPNGEYSVRLSAYNSLGMSTGFGQPALFTVTGTNIEWSDRDNLTFKLNQNYPNPFNPSTRIEYQIPAATQVTLEVYDINGRLIQTLVNEKQVAGEYQVIFDGSALASGVYIYRLTAGDQVLSKKLSLIK